MGRLGRIYYSHYVWLFDGHTVSLSICISHYLSAHSRKFWSRFASSELPHTHQFDTQI